MIKLLIKLIIKYKLIGKKNNKMKWKTLLNLIIKKITEKS